MTACMKVCFMGGLIGSVVIFCARHFFLTETLKRDFGDERKIKENLNEVVPQFQPSTEAMQVASAIYQYEAGPTSELLTTYVTDCMGRTYENCGVILKIMSARSIADRYDRSIKRARKADMVMVKEEENGGRMKGETLSS